VRIDPKKCHVSPKQSENTIKNHSTKMTPMEAKFCMIMVMTERRCSSPA